MTKLAPTRVVGMMMGLWFVSTGAGNYLGGRMASLYGSMSISTLFAITARYRHGRRCCDGHSPQAHRAPDVGRKVIPGLAILLLAPGDPAAR